MLAAVKGYYNGSHIVINEDVNLSTGQEVMHGRCHHLREVLI